MVALLHSWLLIGLLLLLSARRNRDERAAALTCVIRIGGVAARAEDVQRLIIRFEGRCCADRSFQLLLMFWWIVLRSVCFWLLWSRDRTMTVRLPCLFKLIDLNSFRGR